MRYRVYWWELDSRSRKHKDFTSEDDAHAFLVRKQLSGTAYAVSLSLI